MDTIDLTNFYEAQEKAKLRTILTCSVRLDEETMLKILGSKSIFIYGNYYKIPKLKLLECLTNNEYGETRLELEQID